MMLSRILGIFQLAIFILQLTNSSGASAGNSWGQRGVVQWKVQRSRTLFKAAIASNTWCTPFYEYWRRSISFMFLFSSTYCCNFCDDDVQVWTRMLPLDVESEQNKTWKDNPAVSWIVSRLSGKYDTYSGESMCLNWFLNEARYKLCQICIEARCILRLVEKKSSLCPHTTPAFTTWNSWQSERTRGATSPIWSSDCPVDKTSMRLSNRHQKRHYLFIETRTRQDCYYPSCNILGLFEAAVVAESPESPRLGGCSFGISSFPLLLEILSSNSSEKTPALHCHPEQNFFYMAYNSIKWVGEPDQ